MKSSLRRLAAATSLVALTLGGARAEARSVALVRAPLTEATSLGLPPGERVTVSGVVTTTFDGASYDAVTRREQSGTERIGGYFATEGVGLRIVERTPDRVVFEATGEAAPLCVAVGAVPPCLVPRITALAHERLLSTSDFERTMSGAFTLHMVAPPSPLARAAPFVTKAAATLFATGALVAAVALAWGARRRHGQTLAGRVTRAAAAARRRSRDAGLGRRIDELERAARGLAANVVALDGRRGAVAAGGARVEGELARLEEERRRSLVELERIVDALLALAVSPDTHDEERRETAAAALASLDEELALKRDAEAEAARVLG